MRRLKLAGFVLLVLLTAGMPAFHHHSLLQEAGSGGPVCDCAFSTGVIREPAVPTIGIALSGFVTCIAETPAHSVAPLVLASRGPPPA